MKKKLYFSGAVLFLISWISFILVPVTTDIKVFMAGARQAGFLNDGLITGAVLSWELKGIFSRILSCLIFRAVTLFVPFNTYSFEVICKALYSLILIIIILISMLLSFPGEKRKALKAAFVSSLCFMAVHTGCHMQPEMTASLLTLLSFSVYLNAVKTERHKKTKLFIAGLITGSVFFLKSVLILMSVSMTAAVCIFKKEKRLALSLRDLLTTVIGGITALAAGSLLITVINPGEFRDMLDAAFFQDTLISTGINMKRILSAFFYFHVLSLPFIPVAVLGVICLFINIARLFNTGEKASLFFHFILWFMPLLFIVLSNRYFIYHFEAYVFPALIEIYYAVGYAEGKRKKVIGVFSLVLTFWYLTVFSVISPVVFPFIRMDLRACRETEKMLERTGFDREETVLYLDDGTGAYALGNRSYLRYYYPLPLQRLSEDSGLKCQKESLYRALNYTGKYITVYKDWIFKDGKNEDLKKKIADEYEYAGTIYVFTPPHSIRLSDAFTKHIDLYQRKQISP